MHYTVEMEIAAPRDKVTKAFTDPQHFSEWMVGLERYEVVEGVAEQTGARAEIRTAERGKTYDMVETIERNAMPDEFVVVYEVDGVHNRVVNRFAEKDQGTTVWTSVNEFKFPGARKGLELVPFVFKGQSVREMARFKAYVEGVGG
ncbi:MAG TPA: SRPBCC family protein [Coriobacteriia bacterium]|nr:SRPBCC family protein [Coriobacteriia bacterium]